jgi:helicase required for RNAi-mediated heterochromatin assembly 1
MIEARSSYFEASRHMLEALQKLMTEKWVARMVAIACTKKMANSNRFSLAGHIAMVDPFVTAPTYIEAHSIMDLSSLTLSQDTPQGSAVPIADESLLNVDVLQEFPPIPASGMDPSQMSALKSMLTKKVAIVQGPPGCGKTFVSVSALKIMMANMQPEDPPIIVSAQTNHALDQLLNHVLISENRVLRLGGRSSKENEEIQKRTLYQLRQSTRGAPNKNYLIKAAHKAISDRINEIQQLMIPITNFQSIPDIKVFLDHGILTQAHHDSLAGGDWDGDDMDVSGFASCEQSTQ